MGRVEIDVECMGWDGFGGRYGVRLVRCDLTFTDDGKKDESLPMLSQFIDEFGHVPIAL
jgi:hypothetical protein